MTKYCDLCKKDITKSQEHFLSDCQYYNAKFYIRNDNKVGYHVAKINRGTFGEADKIKEECDEFIDALEQGVDIMALVELSDMIGAVNGYLKKYHPSISLKDLVSMSKVTKRAFDNGQR